jgi:hypothetical protein
VKQYGAANSEVTRAHQSAGGPDVSVALHERSDGTADGRGRSSTITPYANDSHGETSETDSSSCLLKYLGGLDSLLDCFAIDIVLVLSKERLSRDKIRGSSKTGDERGPEQVGVSSAGRGESVGKVEREQRDEGERAQVQRGGLLQRDQDMMGGLCRGKGEQRWYGQSGQRVRGTLLEQTHVS